LKEAEFLQSVQMHPNIVGFYGTCSGNARFDDNEMSFVHFALQLEYCSGGDLCSAVEKERFSEAEASVTVTQILLGLKHIHECGIVHRDIKPENVLLAEGGTAKITDFGISALLTDHAAMTRRCGSPGYAAPEIVLCQTYDEKVDVFSVSSLLYFVLSGKVAFSGSCAKSILAKSIDQEVNFRRSPRLERVSDDCKEFIKFLGKKNPDERPTASEALSETEWLSAWGTICGHGMTNGTLGTDCTSYASTDSRMSQESVGHARQCRLTALMVATEGDAANSTSTATRQIRAPTSAPTGAPPPLRYKRLRALGKKVSDSTAASA